MLPSVICLVTRKIGVDRRFELPRHQVGYQKSYAGGECINDEVADTCVAARRGKLRDLDRASEDDQRDRDQIARAITQTERQAGDGKYGEVLESVGSLGYGAEVWGHQGKDDDGGGQKPRRNSDSFQHPGFTTRFVKKGVRRNSDRRLRFMCAEAEGFEAGGIDLRDRVFDEALAGR
jgi:hypothetical protein